MIVTAIVISILLIISAAIHFIIAFYFRTMVMLRPEETIPENSDELASVVMAVRGCDPQSIDPLRARVSLPVRFDWLDDRIR